MSVSCLFTMVTPTGVHGVFSEIGVETGGAAMRAMSSVFAVPGIATHSLAVDVLWLCVSIAGFALGRLEPEPTARSGTAIVLGTTLLIVVMKLIELRTASSSQLPSSLLLIAAGFGLGHTIGTLMSHRVPTAR